MSFVMLIRQLQTLPRDGSWLPQIRGLKFSVSPHTSMEKAVAPHSSTLAWKIPRTEEPGRLQSMGSRRVGHNWATSLSLFTFMHWRRKWQPTPVFLPGESQGRGSLVGRRLWGLAESDTTEATQQQQQFLLQGCLLVSFLLIRTFIDCLGWSLGLNRSQPVTE